jgi:hypothetical protein
VEVRWRSLLRSTSVGKPCIYNAPPTSRKRAADRSSLRDSCLAAPFSWLEKPRNRMGRDMDCMEVVLMEFLRSNFPSRTQNSIQISSHAISGLFQPWKGSSEGRNFEVINGLQHVFEKSVECCKSASLAKGGTTKKRPSPHLHKVQTRSYQVSPRTSQTALVYSPFIRRTAGYSTNLISLLIHHIQTFRWSCTWSTSASVR